MGVLFPVRTFVASAGLPAQREWNDDGDGPSGRWGRERESLLTCHFGMGNLRPRHYPGWHWNYPSWRWLCPSWIHRCMLVREEGGGDLALDFLRVGFLIISLRGMIWGAICFILFIAVSLEFE